MIFYRAPRQEPFHFIPNTLELVRFPCDNNMWNQQLTKPTWYENDPTLKRCQQCACLYNCKMWLLLVRFSKACWWRTFYGAVSWSFPGPLVLSCWTWPGAPSVTLCWSMGLLLWPKFRPGTLCWSTVLLLWLRFRPGTLCWSMVLLLWPRFRPGILCWSTGLLLWPRRFRPGTAVTLVMLFSAYSSTHPVVIYCAYGWQPVSWMSPSHWCLNACALCIYRAGYVWYHVLGWTCDWPNPCIQVNWTF